jgi:hypothetical protein
VFLCSIHQLIGFGKIRILGGEYFEFEYEYLFSSVQIYLIFVFGQIDLTNIYSVYIRYGFAGYLAYIRYIFEYQARNIHYSNTNILFHWSEYIRYSYFVKIKLCIYSYSYLVRNLIFVLHWGVIYSLNYSTINVFDFQH